MPAVKGQRTRNPRSKASAKGKKTRRGKRKATPLEMVGAAFARATGSALTVVSFSVAVLTFVALLMLLAGGYFWNVGERVHTLTARMAKGSGFATTKVLVTGADALPDRDIIWALSDGGEIDLLGGSVLHYDLTEARDRLMALGRVEGAAVHRLWPGTISVVVTERQPRALFQDPMGAYHLVDGQGVIVAAAQPTGHTDLPVIAGTSDPALAADMLTALSARPELLARVAAIYSVGGRRFDLRFRNDFTARLPEDDLDLALGRLEGLGAGTGKLASTLDYIDLRDPEWAYLKPKT